MEIFDRTIDHTGKGVGIGRNGTRMAAIFSAVASLNFPSIPANTGAELTIAVPGAAVGDEASVAYLGATPEAGLAFNAYVSAANVVTVRALNVTVGAIDPAAANFRAIVRKWQP